MKFPLCSEVCEDCRDGRHIMHIISELGDLYVHKVEKPTPGIKHYNYIKIEGWAEDELWLEDLLRVVSLEYKRGGSV